MKTFNNPQGPHTLLAEVIVAGVGTLLNAPVCTTQPIWIGEEHAGFKYCKSQPTLELIVGYGSASLEVPDTLEIKGDLHHQTQDDNPRRQVGVVALYDLCWGSDNQWLYQSTADQTIYSHDHGLYLWTGQWWGQDLEGLCGVGQIPSGDLTSLDGEAIDQMAQRLRELTWDKLDSVLSKIPPSWPATDDQLVQLGEWLLKRAPGSAERLEALKGGEA